MWQKEEWNFDKAWNVSVYNNVSDPRGHGFVEKRTFGITRRVPH
jgi:hypothetical protein